MDDDKRDLVVGTETGGGGSRIPPRFTALDTRDNNGHPSAGKTLNCTIANPRGGGYFVIVSQYPNARAFLASTAHYNVGDSVQATYVCQENGTYLLSPHRGRYIPWPDER